MSSSLTRSSQQLNRYHGDISTGSSVFLLNWLLFQYVGNYVLFFISRTYFLCIVSLLLGSFHVGFFRFWTNFVYKMSWFISVCKFDRYDYRRNMNSEISNAVLKPQFAISGVVSCNNRIKIHWFAMMIKNLTHLKIFLWFRICSEKWSLQKNYGTSIVRL